MSKTQPNRGTSCPVCSGEHWQYLRGPVARCITCGHCHPLSCPQRCGDSWQEEYTGPNLFQRCGCGHRVGPITRNHRRSARVRKIARRDFGIAEKSARCVWCPRLATIVDHITRLADGGLDVLRNMQPMCHWCHWWKTSLESKGRGRCV